MEIKFFCPQWGSDHLSPATFFDQVKNAGYDGIEMSLPVHLTERKKVLQLFKKYELLHIAQHWETLTGNFDSHQKEYRQRVENLASANPFMINSQTGKDYFTFEQNALLIAIAGEVSAKYGVAVIHETHRGKFSFAAHITADYLTRLPQLRLGLDISHWCNVAESYLDDQGDAVNLALSRTDHIHARVGYPQGPQITDPRLPEWQEAVQRHIGWWKSIVKQKEESGQQVFTVTPEFGPFPYMAMLPFTQQPVSNQWEINIHMMKLLKSAFAEE